MILAIDTATRWAGLALHDGTAVIAEYGWRCLNNHTVELSPAIEDMLSRIDKTINDLDGIAVAIGPGSYTGLRVGLALAKGMALANQIPLFGVPTLDIIAFSMGQMPLQLLVAAEAGRSRVCAAVYQWQEKQGWKPRRPPIIDTWENIVNDIEKPTLFAGEITPEAAKLIRNSNQNFAIAFPAVSTRRAGYLAEMGWQRLRKNQMDDAASLAPIYLRDPAGK
ncbi:MAG: tRNA (adenosine(37)-N6)-threonylcarbamoyltransferase complex dimerization subunit type 1 TsaB [Chloroflexi bacterium]|nr:MAG: tRNA (adenosine(37)-N6)-threonylcarbamoyltransferase complex dimerization subunit type 1 TsaB [Chloroflexota bacterium]PIE81604.1 MAG: tRNA (adenosine(37)-N6)-threonylcarbamoyltransferase complex dimerization subunit type 1 TsaB [Chloroflexota bacterium]